MVPSAARSRQPPIETSFLAVLGGEDDVLRPVGFEQAFSLAAYLVD